MTPQTGQLHMEKILKVFGPVTALKNATFSTRPGTVHALCGENGAGKSTLMKILSGVYQPDGGKIVMDDREIEFKNPGQALDAGISMLYQELDLAEDLTVYENIFLGNELISRIPLVVNRREMISRTAELCRQNGFDIQPTAMIKSLTLGQCQIVELLKALMRKAKIIVMDEPTSSLTESEAQRLFKIVKDLRTQGLTIIYISHRMEEVIQLADDISVLRDGEIVATGSLADMNISTIVKHMVGRELDDFFPPRHTKIGEIYFQAIGLKSNEGVQEVSFDVRRGEIVGMAGLVGAGRTEVARTIFGLQQLTAGHMKLDNKPVKIKHPSDAIKKGIALLTEDRKRSGLCTILPCSWNMTLPNYTQINMKYFLKLSKERQLCEKFGQKVSVKWSHPNAPANSLSGGNQQKILVGRWLMANSEFMIFDEPTRGIDIGAKKEIYHLLNELAAENKAILFISSELPELFGVCDRILVMRRGRLVGDLKTQETTPEKVMHLAAVEE
ncbi:MAG: sugar ABC transporter ATP-binding protein [Phycisphaerae bacterium]|nr:sugar ABC transporter ATP-binding protein [Phycisphaerae bacterium]